MFSRLLSLFIIIPIIEIALLFTVGKIITGPVTLLIIIVTGLLGALLTRSQGLRTFLAFRSGSTPPQEAAADGLMIIVAGVLLITPGFLTDFVGFSLLCPPIRSMIRRFAMRQLVGKMTGSFTGSFTMGGMPSMDPTPQPQPSVSDNSDKKERPTVIDV